MVQTLEQKLRQQIRTISNFPKQGIEFKDLQSILLQPALTKEVTDALTTAILKEKPDAILGLDSRGFLFGTLLAQRLKIPFIMVRKPGKLPPPVVRCRYEKEYGTDTLEMSKDVIPLGSSVHIHDDLIATGGSLKAVVALAKRNGLQISGISCIMELKALNGKGQLPDVPITTLVKF